MFRSFLALLLTMVLAVSGMLLSFAGSLGTHGIRSDTVSCASSNYVSVSESHDARGEQVVPGSGLDVSFEEELEAPGDVLLRSWVETRPVLGIASESERNIASRPRDISRTVDLPPPRRA